ncbi:preprotein translocase subunit YajC [Lactobacillus mulieris]|jgi:preprotein translocase, yajC subunit|uniref:Preprotein translocase subunit YajC n=1 Tax=Lactobacillus mulieris TaxID=2508708 RepID=A0AAP3M3G5_9LACO|nr:MULTISPECIES: preprotein translocase subunit YajC [Lactobacillus]EEU20465.1 preprotein translocase, YajC subunit [Lactobacillus jensenii 27-2-CHN]EEX23466.1 preprotein translocase, YajC subunit [Lactobacillus jensenii 115-3-CHN]EFH30481.1 preprotein translocase, YajC subunit [Lactobacillus jensenii JV-V16]KAA9244729.1 preprotein translocase subunit YajC [Lactobacillus jensenii]KAA9367376.1 preprotein translocase subunit YajC [Lactobacillus jensenii]
MNISFMAAAAGFGSYSTILMMVVLVGFTYFFMIKPQKKRQQQAMDMLSKLKKGDKVILVSGLHAKIDSVNDKNKTVVVDADGIFLTFSKMAVRQVVEAAPEQEVKPAETEEKAASEEEKANEDK